MLKTKYSLLVILFCGFIGIYSIFNMGKWKNKGVITWDTISYYSYLPATFIYKDLSLNFIDSNKHYFGDKFWPGIAPNGGKVVKTTMGLSLMYAPFFAAAHVYAQVMDYDADGFSLPYQLFLALSASFYLMLGLYFLAKILQEYFNDRVIAITLLCVYFGTNMLCYTTIESTMSHTYNFALIAGFIRYTIKWHADFTWKNTMILGLLCGIIVLIRPVNMLILLFPLFYAVHSIASWKAKWNLLFQHIGKVVAMGIITVLLFFPQLFYWKYNTGNWFYNSYEGEGFYFGNPHIIDGLFGFRKGWFIYTPMMFLAIISLFFTFKNERFRSIFFSSVIFSGVCIYVVLSWWCWWYGGGFSIRAFIDFYAVWAIFLAFFIEKVLSFTSVKRAFLLLFLFALIALNSFQTYQYKKGIIHWDSMTKEEYLAVFGKLHYPPNAELLIRAPDYERARKGLD